ncbi:MAG: cysteine methyltransferase, partial [Steroidobacteraceae bacterium]
MSSRYFIFDTASGFCAVAWNDVGITRFQLPAPAADAAKKHLLRRLTSAAAATPPAEI